jgi:hypothetical protein
MWCFPKEARLGRTEVAIHIGRGIVNGGASTAETRAAFDAAAKRMRRLRDHHAQAREAFEVSKLAKHDVLAPLAEGRRDQRWLPR